jgi:ABC-2 type transport system ATP-binding protein
VIFPQVNALIAQRGWNVSELNVERGRLDEVFRSLTRGEVV